jgi:hypothetical protein
LLADITERDLGGEWREEGIDRGRGRKWEGNGERGRGKNREEMGYE